MNDILNLGIDLISMILFIKKEIIFIIKELF
jgi:hypothetical protein